MVPALAVLLLSMTDHALGLAVPARLSAVPAAMQAVVLDRMLATVNGSVITESDLRAVRALRLFGDPLSATDDQLVDRMIERRLMIAEVARYTPAEPKPEQIAARRQAWEASLPSGTDIPATLHAVGMRPEALDERFRDDLRISTYLDQRFNAAAQPTRQQAQAYFQAHRDEFTVNGATPPFADIEADVRTRVARERRETRIREWIESLKARAEIRRLG